MKILKEYYDAEIAEEYLIYIPPEKDCVYIKGYKIDGFDGFENFYEHLKKYHDVEKELKSYKSLEEQGLLHKLPCKVGDDVYFIPSKVNFQLNILHHNEKSNRVYHQKIARIHFCESGWYVEGNLNIEYGLVDRIFVDVMYRETWFLSKEEAEAKLQELQNGVTQSNDGVNELNEMEGES